LYFAMLFTSFCFRKEKDRKDLSLLA